MKTNYFLVPLGFLAFSLAMFGDINRATPPPPQTGEPEPMPVEWIKAGRLVVYNLQGATNFPPTAIVYFGPGGIGRLVFNGAPEQVNWIMRSEFPAGVTPEFVRDHIVSVLSGFATLERPIDREERIEAVEQARGSIAKDPELKKKLEALLESPKITFSGDNRWKVQYQSYAGERQLSLAFAEGTLRPFRIIRLGRYSLLPARIEGFDATTLAQATTAKEQALVCESAVESAIASHNPESGSANRGNSL